ncbi:MAG: SAM-dependent methyltransferase [Clostridia bacterium]|nr:SAM-dependent methyltransferase [Clostridia bacterium]
MNNTELDNRLLACASLVRQGSVAADIGSDHAYLPIYLVRHGICPRAIASDINEGPVNRAKINVRLSGLSDKIDILLADGLDKAASYKPDDIIIAGMGGELIRDIIGASEYAKTKGVRLILQPMTMPHILREYLAGAGFNIIDEMICSAQDKYYQIICAEYDGTARSFTEHELLLGKINIERLKTGLADAESIELIRRTAKGAEYRLAGISRAAVPDETAIKKERGLIAFCESLLEKY